MKSNEFISNARVQIYLHLFNALKHFKIYDRDDRFSDLSSLEIGHLTVEREKLYMRRWQVSAKDEFKDD